MDRTELSPEVEVELDIFSGRPNPRWMFGGDTAREFLQATRTKEPAKKREPPDLGYRGFLLRAPDGSRVRAFQGVLSVEKDSRASAFTDSAGIELRLLAYAREQGLGDLLDAFGAPRVEQAG
jgi:hypothetical protein